MKTALLIHGAYGNPKENWMPWLKEELEQFDYEVIAPTFPTPENQNLGSWLDVLKPRLAKLDNESVLVGHSIGAVFMLSILEKLKSPIYTAVFVSGFLHDLGNNDFDKINNSFYDKDFDWQLIKGNARSIVVFHGDDDPYVPLKEAKYLAENLGTKIKVIKNGGHLNESAGFTEFPELLKVIKITPTHIHKIYLARHGQDEDNARSILNGQRDASLTHIGIEQANVLAQTIKSLDLNIDKVYSSPLQRAYRTAEIVTDTLGLTKPEKLDLLIERNFGIMTGKPTKDIEKLCAPNIIKSSTITYFLSPEGAETFPQLLERGTQILGWLKENNTNENILLVSHGDIGKMIYATFYNLNWKEVLTQFHFGNSEILLLAENSRPEERHLHKVKQHNH